MDRRIGGPQRATPPHRTGPWTNSMHIDGPIIGGPDTQQRPRDPIPQTARRFSIGQRIRGFILSLRSKR